MPDTPIKKLTKTLTSKVVFTPEEEMIIAKYRPTPPADALPPHPGIFQKSPIMQGSGELSATYRAIAKAFPWLTQDTPTKLITEGLTKDSTDALEESNRAVMQQGHGTIFEPEDFPSTGLYGLHNTQTHNVTVRPGQTPMDARQTLVHELLHALGYRGEGMTGAMDAQLMALRKK